MNTPPTERHPLVTDEQAKESIGLLPLGCMAFVKNEYMVNILSHFARALEAKGEVVWQLLNPKTDKLQAGDEIKNLTNVWESPWAPADDSTMRGWCLYRRKCNLPSRAEVEELKKQLAEVTARESAISDARLEAFKRIMNEKIKELQLDNEHLHKVTIQDTAKCMEIAKERDKLQSELGNAQECLALVKCAVSDLPEHVEASIDSQLEGVTTKADVIEALQRKPWTPKYVADQAVILYGKPAEISAVHVDSYHLKGIPGAWTEAELSPAEEKPEPSSNPEPLPSIPSEEECNQLFNGNSGGYLQGMWAVRTALVTAYEARIADLTRRLESEHTSYLEARRAEEQAKQERNRVGVEIRGEWMGKVHQLEQRAERAEAESNALLQKVEQLKAEAYDDEQKLKRTEAELQQKTQELEKEEKDRLKAISERDSTEAALGDMFGEVMGHHPDWSNSYDLRSAVSDVSAAVATMQYKDAEQRRTIDSLRAQLAALSWRSIATPPTEKDADDRGRVEVLRVDDDGTRKVESSHWDSFGIKNPASKGFVWSHWRPTNLPPIADSRAEQLAQKFHEAYERLAPSFGYETRKDSAKPWSEVPEQNKQLMIAVCAELEAARKGEEGV